MNNNSTATQSKNRNNKNINVALPLAVSALSIGLAITLYFALRRNNGTDDQNLSYDVDNYDVVSNIPFIYTHH